MIAARKTNEQADADADAELEGSREERRARWQAREEHGNARQELPDAGWQQAPWAPRVRVAAAGRVLLGALGEHSQWHEALSSVRVQRRPRGGTGFSKGVACARKLGEGALAGGGVAVVRWLPQARM